MRPQHRVALRLLALVVLVSAQLTLAQNKKVPRYSDPCDWGNHRGAAATGIQAAYTSSAVGIDTMLAAVPVSKILPTSRVSRYLTSDRRA